MSYSWWDMITLAIYNILHDTYLIKKWEVIFCIIFDEENEENILLQVGGPIFRYSQGWSFILLLTIEAMEHYLRCNVCPEWDLETIESDDKINF